MTGISFRVGPNKESLEKRIDVLMQKMGITVRGQFINKLIEIAEEQYLDFDEINKLTDSDKKFIESIGCQYLDKEGNNFYCYERMKRYKYPTKLGKDKHNVRKRCEGCKSLTIEKKDR